MKRRAVALTLVLLAGCVANTGKVAEEARLAYEAFIRQQRTYEAVAIRGERMRVSLEGANEIVLSGQLTPLSAMPREGDAVPRIADAVKNAVLGAVGIWALRDIATREPTVVTQPEPMVVRPEVITVGP